MQGTHAPCSVALQAELTPAWRACSPGDSNTSTTRQCLHLAPSQAQEAETAYTARFEELQAQAEEVGAAAEANREQTEQAEKAMQDASETAEQASKAMAGAKALVAAAREESKTAAAATAQAELHRQEVDSTVALLVKAQVDAGVERATADMANELRELRQRLASVEHESSAKRAEAEVGLATAAAAGEVAGPAASD